MSEQYSLMEQYKNGSYEEVISAWKNSSNGETFNEWDFLAVANSCKKTKQYEECISVYKAFHKKYPDSNMMDNQLGWALYYTKIRDFDFDSGDIQGYCKQVDYIITHSTGGKFSPRWAVVKTFFKAAKEGKIKGEQNYALCERYLASVNPDDLSKDEQSFQGSDGRTYRIASDLETWYSDQSVALLRLKKYAECIECCDKALAEITRFHSNNDSWFRFRKAESLLALGRADEARSSVLEILNTGFTHWRILQCMFEFERDAGNTDKAMSYAGACAISDPTHEMRVAFYPEFADFLDANGRSEEAMLHRKLTELLREENGWPRKPEQEAWQYTPEIAGMDKPAVLNRLKPFWREMRDKDKVYLTGTVDRLLGEGASGFIAADDGGSYYFNAKDMRTHGGAEIGRRVRFILVDRLDKSKGVVKKNAVEIEEIPENGEENK